MNRLRFRSLASGSSGNCYFIGNATYGILIDAGVGVRSIKHFLKAMGLDFSDIWGVFVTHDHSDHIQSVGILGEKYHIPIYATRNVHEGINRNYRVTQKLSSSQRFIEVGQEVEIGELKVIAFGVSHDASESVGYSVEYCGKTVTFATDLGVIGEEAASYLIKSDSMIIEANYDEFMLENGPYPLMLQARIKSETGHLCNTQTADFIAENYSERWKYIFLCHLSKENNNPEMAQAAIADKMKDSMIDFEGKTEIIPLERLKPSEMYFIE